MTQEGSGLVSNDGVITADQDSMRNDAIRRKLDWNFLQLVIFDILETLRNINCTILLVQEKY